MFLPAISSKEVDTLLAFAYLGLLLVPAMAAQTASAPDYKNSQLPVERRVQDLLQRMTLQEKAAQLMSVWETRAIPGQPRILSDERGQFDPQRARKVLEFGLGQVTRPSEGRGPREMALFTNALQKWVVENTRLGIPVMFHEEALHGHAARNGTHFPQAIALASTWNPALLEQVFAAVAKEVRARGAQQVLAPVLDLGRDPRWGRIEETYGEDPYLVARLGLAAIRGYQGSSSVIDKEHVIATAKHFAVHGQPEAGMNAGPNNYSERVVREQFLYPFQVAVTEGKVGSIMPSYNEVDGIPSHANRLFLEQILRREWGFRGLVVSDYFGIRELQSLHRVAADTRQAARMALETGVDLELPFPECYRHLVSMVRESGVPESLVDQAVARVLTAKFNTGLFDDPYTDPDLSERVTNCDAHRKLARQAAHEAIILLKNDKGLLPLDRTKYRTIAVIGPNAHKRLLGGYSDDPGYFVTVLDGVRAKAGDSLKILYEEGCKITADDANWYKDEVRLPDPADDAKRIAEAVKTAEAADLVILAIGGNEAVSREAWSPQHLGDMDTLDLLGRQNDLAQAVVKTGKPVVALLLNGRPYGIKHLVENVPAILEGWYLGQETGHAVADVLFGDYNPAGRLPVTIPRGAGQLPVYYNLKPSARRGYLFGEKDPLFWFGHGLSYTSFLYSNLRVSPARISRTGEATLSVDVANAGGRAGDEVVQMYIRDEVSTVTRPLKELRDFARIHLKPGESRTVQFRITPDRLSFLDQSMQRVVEPGTFEIMVGGNSVDTKSVKLEVVE